MERPALQQLLASIQAEAVDVVVVYNAATAVTKIVLRIFTLHGSEEEPRQGCTVPSPLLLRMQGCLLGF